MDGFESHRPQQYQFGEDTMNGKQFRKAVYWLFWGAVTVIALFGYFYAIGLIK